MALVSDTIFSLLVLATGVLGASTVGFAMAWMRARERAIRAEQGLAPTAGGDARFDRLEQAVEAVAVEVERMSEGQRFVNRVLAERPAQGQHAVAQAAGVATAR